MGREQFSNLRAGHVTLRVVDEIPSLRCRDFVEDIRDSFGKACERGDFRLIHYSVQHDHLHLLGSIAEVWNALRYVLHIAAGIRPPTTDYAIAIYSDELW